MRVEININLDLRHKIENSAARASAIIEAASKEFLLMILTHSHERLAEPDTNVIIWTIRVASEAERVDVPVFRATRVHNQRRPGRRAAP